MSKSGLADFLLQPLQFETKMLWDKVDALSTQMMVTNKRCSILPIEAVAIETQQVTYLKIREKKTNKPTLQKYYMQFFIR